MNKIRLYLNKPHTVIAIFVLAMLVLFVYQQQGKVHPTKTFADAPAGLVGPPASCDFYASPSGSPSGDGSTGNPWSLQAALNNTAQVNAGKTLCLKGGTYSGRYQSNLSGTSGNPVVIRSAPGEWAKIDGNYTTTLATAIPAGNPYESFPPVRFNGNLTFTPGAAVFVDNEQLQINGVNQDGSYAVVRGWNGTTTASHNIGASVMASDTILSLLGSYTWIRDFEITNSSTQRITVLAERGSGVYSNSPGTKIINMVIDNVGHPGIGLWAGADDNSEVYGSLVWGSGIYDTGGSWIRGAGIYTQNQNSTKYIRDNFWFRNFTEGISIYATNGYVDGFDVEGNISFDQRGSQNIWAGSSNVNPIQRLKIISNYTYRRGVSDDNQWDTRIGYTTNNIDAEVRNNYMVSNNVVFNSNAFSQLIFTGNTLYARDGRQLHFDQTSKTSYNVDNNHFYGSNQFTYGPNGPGGSVDFTQWKSGTGYDTNSTYSSSLPPDTYAVRPNLYEQGRANIVVYNWSNASTVNVDISNAGLQNGQSYEIRDAQNIFGSPVVTGTYNGSSVNLPMNLTSIASVIGNVTHINNINQHTPSEFATFVVLPVYGTSQADTTPPVLSSGSPTGAQPAGTTSVNLSVTTDENATCKYGTTAGIAYASIANTFTTTGSVSHSKTLTGLTNGTSYTYYVRCQDSSSNANTSDYTISFSVSNPAGDTTPPTVSVTAPSNNATVSGSTTTVSATATDNVGVVGVQFKLDGTNLGPEDTSSPYSISWDTTGASNASHTLTAVARDAAGNSTTSTAITVTVNNAVPPSTVSTPTISPNGGTFNTAQSVTLATSTSGASIYYTLDNSTPTSASTLYSSPFQVATTATVKAIAIKSGSTDSSVSSATFTIATPPIIGGGGGSGSGGSGGSGGGGGSTPPTTPPSSSSPRLVNSSGTYYFTESGLKKGITSPGILYSCGFEFKDAKTASSSDLTLPTSLLLPCGGALVKSVQDPTVYLISQGQRYAFTSSTVFTSLGFKFSSVLLVTDPELQALPKNTELNNPSAAHLPDTDINYNGTVYWIDTNHQRHPYPSLNVYNSWHKDGDFTTVVPANSADLSLTTGSTVTSRVVQ